MPITHKKVNRTKKVVCKGKKMSGGSRKVNSSRKVVRKIGKMSTGSSRKIAGRSRKVGGGKSKSFKKTKANASRSRGMSMFRGALSGMKKYSGYNSIVRRRALNFIRKEPNPAIVTRATYAKIITGKPLGSISQKVIDSIERYKELLPKYKGLPDNSPAKLEFFSKFQDYPTLVKMFNSKTT